MQVVWGLDPSSNCGPFQVLLIQNFRLNLRFQTSDFITASSSMMFQLRQKYVANHRATVRTW